MWNVRLASDLVTPHKESKEGSSVQQGVGSDNNNFPLEYRLIAN